MFKNRKCFFALILALLIVISSLPTSVFANQSIDDMGNYINLSSDIMAANSVENTENEFFGGIVEIESLREENVKHFRLENGTFEAVVYPKSVHRKDQNGIWQNIDNSLSMLSSNGVLQVSTNDNRIQFLSENELNSPKIVLSENGYCISMNLIESNKIQKNTSEIFQNIISTEPIINNSEKNLNNKDSSIEKPFEINNKSSVLYSNVRTNIDIEYILNGNDLKENIIIKTPCEN